MKKKVVKTTFEKEQRSKEEAFLRMKPLERMAYMLKLRERAKKPGVNYSYAGMTVKVKRGK